MRTSAGVDAPRDLSYVATTRMLSRERDNAGETHYYDYDSRGERQGQANAPTTTADPSSFRSYGHDANGTVEELQASDGSVADGERYRYDPYGELERRDPASVAPSTDPLLDPAEAELSAQGRSNPFRFQGFYYDSGVKTYDMHARHYRPDTGRFLTQDRFESARGDFNLQADPLTQNRYVFGGANPVNNIEFDGHCSDACQAGGYNVANRRRRSPDITTGRKRTRLTRSTGRPTWRNPITGNGANSGRGRLTTTAPRTVSVGARGGCGAFGGICSAGRALGRAGSSAGRAVASIAGAGYAWHLRERCRSGSSYACAAGSDVRPEPLGADNLVGSALWIAPWPRLALWAVRGGPAAYRLLRSRNAAMRADDLPPIRGGATPRGAVKPHQIHGLDEALEYARRGTGRIKRDATPFRNESGALPPGNYRKWTVRTPGQADRGQRRLVVSDDGRAYYTWNHYRDFVAVRP